MNVGYKLYREVRDFAPADWTASELLVALILADDANDATRRSWIPLPLLCQRTRLTERGLRAVLHKLAGGGYEFRVAHGYGKDGRPVFAARNHAVDYLIPDMLKGGTTMPPKPVDNPDGRRHAGAANPERKAARSGKKGGTDLQKGGTLVPPLSSDLLSIPSKNNGRPVITPSVEGTQRGVVTVDNPIPMSAAEAAAWNAVYTRNQP